MGNSLDSLGRERFHPLSLKDGFDGYHFPGYPSNIVKRGHDCCSNETISFHYTSVEEMELFSTLANKISFQDLINKFI